MNDKLQSVKTLLHGIVLDDEHYLALRHLLERQRLCIIKRDCDELASVNAQIIDSYERLKEGTRQRRTLLTQLGVTLDRDGMEQVFSWLPAEQKRRAQGAWRQLEKRVAGCKSWNEKNGELLTMQNAFAQSFLGTEPDFLYHP